MKGTFLGLLVLALLAAPAPLQAQFYYTTNADGVTLTITYYSGPGGAVTIPTNINGLVVTGIGEAAFDGCPGLTSISISASVTTIGDYAFSGCPGLTEINVDAQNASYSSTNGVLFDKEQTTLLQYPWGMGGFYAIPASVTSIGDAAFYGIAVLTGVTIPGSVTTIGDDAFEWCSALTNVAILGSVTNIGENAFCGCSSLTSVVIPGSVTNIGEFAFAACAGLTNAIFANGVAGIGVGWFENCANLTSVTIPASVTNIGVYAFMNCPRLISVFCQGNAPTADWTSFGTEWNATIYYVLGTAGWGSSFFGLQTLPRPQDIFSYTTNADDTLTITGYTWTNVTVTIPNNINGLPVTSIGEAAFFDSSVTIVTIPGGITSIGDLAFYGAANLAGIMIPDSVTNIGPFAFYGCASLASITIPAGVASIDDATFYECSSLTDVTISEGVTSVGDLAFYGCSSLSSVMIPDSVTSLGSQAFGYCTNLASVYFNGDPPTVAASVFCTDNATAYYVVGISGWGSSFAGLPVVIQIPYYYTTNQDNTLTVFEYTGNGGTVIIPTNINGLTVSSIGGFTFHGAKLTSVIIPGSVTSIGGYAFYQCSSLVNASIADGVASIGEYAFAGSGLISVTIPGSVTNIADFAFQECPGLKAITVDSNNAFYSSLNGVLYDKKQTTLIQYPCGLEGSFTFPDSVTCIKDSAFAGCLHLASIAIPASITNIEEGALSGWNNLTNATLATGVTSIVADMFWGCWSLTSVTIPDTVTNIGETAFWGCSSLPGITIPDSVVSIGRDAFYNCSHLTSIIIPASVTNIGGSAFFACLSLGRVYFEGKPPGDSSIFQGAPTVYYLPGASGWGSNYSGCPALLWNPQIQSADGNLGLRSNQFGFNITGTPTIPVAIEACTNLASPVWSRLQTLTLSTGSFYFSDHQWTNHTTCYYRISSY